MMFRNQYDNDVTIWSPQGRLHQVEYAVEAVKLGSATVGIKNKTHTVIVALKRAASELSAYQKKIFPIDDHIAISISGLTADARILSRFMRSECLTHKFTHDAPLPVTRLMLKIGNKMQVCTQRYDKRPYGVGLLIAGFDDKGPHLYQTCPSANFYDCKAMAIGSRSQSARTYLEKHLDQFLESTTDAIVLHALRALRDTLPNDVELTTKNVSIGLVGKGTSFYELDENEMKRFLSTIEGEERRAPPTATESSSAPDDDSSGGHPPPDPVPTVAMDTE